MKIDCWVQRTTLKREFGSGLCEVNVKVRVVVMES